MALNLISRRAGLLLHVRNWVVSRHSAFFSNIGLADSQLLAKNQIGLDDCNWGWKRTYIVTIRLITPAMN